MLVSIVIPNFNSLEYVEETVRSAFAQTFSPLEVIVVDDGSNDGSFELLQSLKETEFPQLQLMRHEDFSNHGVSSTRRRGVEEASGEYIALLDSDDVFLPDKIERQVEIFSSNSDVILCHAGMKIIGDLNEADSLEKLFNFRPTRPYDYHKQPDFLKRNGIGCSSVMVRRDLLLSVPFEMTQIFQFEDWLCWCLLAPEGKFFYLDEQLTLYRAHPASATSAVRKNLLVARYSQLELKLALAAKSQSLAISLRALVSAIRTLPGIMLIYGKETISSEKYRHRGVLYRFMQFLRCLRHGSEVD